MQIHIDRNGQKFGPYSVEEAKSYLASGQLLPDDLAWHDGLPGYVPLAQCLASLLAAPVAAAPAPLTASPGEAKASFWQRFKGTIELVSALAAVIGLAYGAYQYFKPTEEKLPAEEQYALAHQYLEGNGTDKNVKRGGELLELAAQKGHVKSMVELGMFAKEGKAGRKKDYGEALKWFELAAEAGDGRALCEIGVLYRWGHGLEEDMGKALKYFREAGLC